MFPRHKQFLVNTILAESVTLAQLCHNYGSDIARYWMPIVGYRFC